MRLTKTNQRRLNAKRYVSEDKHTFYNVTKRKNNSRVFTTPDGDSILADPNMVNPADYRAFSKSRKPYHFESIRENRNNRVVVGDFVTLDENSIRKYNRKFETNFNNNCRWIVEKVDRGRNTVRIKNTRTSFTNPISVIVNRRSVKLI